MNYERIYNEIICKRKQHMLHKGNICCETHHIVPVSFDKSLAKDNDNLVNLTPREHYICHKLLHKISLQKFGSNSNEYRAMSYCLFRMSKNNKYCSNSRDYEKFRKEYSLFLKKNYIGENNPMYGRTGKMSHSYGKPRSEETKRKISEAHKGKKLS